VRRAPEPPRPADTSVGHRANPQPLQVQRGAKLAVITHQPVTSYAGDDGLITDGPRSSPARKGEHPMPYRIFRVPTGVSLRLVEDGTTGAAYEFGMVGDHDERSPGSPPPNTGRSTPLLRS
jgi:hypothetical protein